MVTRNELVAIINMAYDAVNASKVGPIYMEGDDGQQVLKNIAYTTYLYAVQKLIPGVVDAKMTGEFTEGDKTMGIDIDMGG